MMLVSRSLVTASTSLGVIILMNILNGGVSVIGVPPPLTMPSDAWMAETRARSILDAKLSLMWHTFRAHAGVRDQTRRGQAIPNVLCGMFTSTTCTCIAPVGDGALHYLVIYRGQVSHV